mmetsp:Transcript_18057/g.51337  ORF Transcript_18057/g.51337 Transcript_18057/m.51337 type:complete len:203 (+) Transcript_18057:595-1203(+)
MFFWHVEVDHVLNAFDVDAATSDVGGDQDIVCPIFESRQGCLSDLLRLSAMQRRRFEVHLIKGLGKYVSHFFLVDEDHDRWSCLLKNLLQTLLLLGLRHKFKALLNCTLSGPRVSDGNVRRCTKIFSCKALYCRRHRCREHVGDAILSVSCLCLQFLFRGLVFVFRLQVGARNLVQYPVNNLFKTHIYHPVSLIQHQVCTLV